MLYLLERPAHRKNATTSWPRSGTRLVFCGITKCFGQGPVCLKIKSSFHLCQFYIEKINKKGAIFLFRILLLFIMLGIKS
jgi:hypothetical protein